MTFTDRSALVGRVAIAATLPCVVVLPVLAGLWQTARAAFGVLPAIGAVEPSLAAVRALLAVPGFATSVGLSLFTGASSTAIAVLLAVGFITIWWRPSDRPRLAWLTPLLATPHAAIGIGLAFIVAPSGWIARLLAAPLGLERPPMLASVNDPLGFALILGLVVKEVPFLIFILVSALAQVPVARLLKVGRSLGHTREGVWFQVIWPQVWSLVRLPVLIVLAYSLSVVDMAIILGPSNPPTLAVLVTRLFSNPDLQMLLPASAGALVQLGLVGIAFLCVLWLERAVAWIGRASIRRAKRSGVHAGLARVTWMATGVAVVLGGLSLLALIVWSLAWRWPWPMILPETWSMRAWTASSAEWAEALGNTLILSALSTAASLGIAVSWLETEDRLRQDSPAWVMGLFYLPLIVPQVSFLVGLNALAVGLGVSGGFAAVVFGHVLFVFPYVMLALRDPWRRRDRRLDRTAAALGAGPWKRLWRVKLPVLLAPLAAAAAVGVAVSVAQYLPTLFLGGGRIATLTTEAVTLSSSSDRRVVGVHASLQALVPVLAFGLAALAPTLLLRTRGRRAPSVPE